MSEKKHKKSLEELCRNSRVSRTTVASEMWSLSKKSSHRLFRSPSPRASCSRSRRRSENARRSFLVSRPLSTEFIPGTSAMQHSAASHEAEKRTKKPFFPGIASQVMTHADPPFAGTDTQPLPPINMPRGQDGSNSSKLGKDNRPFTVYGQMPFEGGVAYDLIFAANQERATTKRKLEAIKRPEEQDRQERYNSSGQPMQDSEHCGKKKCSAIKKGRRAGKFPKPLAWKSPWPSQDIDGCRDDSDTEWDDIN